METYLIFLTDFNDVSALRRIRVKSFSASCASERLAGSDSPLVIRSLSKFHIG